MNRRHVAGMFLALLIAGCAGPKQAEPPKSTTTSVRRGRDFDSARVKDIQKGKTTTREIVEWFGEPSAKRVVSTDQVGWLYAWRNSTVTVDRSKTTARGRETGYQKRLELLISNEVVMNFTFNEGPIDTDGTRDFK